MEYLGLDSIDGIPGACQVSQTGKSVYQVETSFKSEPGTLIRAERSAGERAVSGICGESGESLKTLPDFPQTNSKPSVKSGGFSIDGSGSLEGSQDAGGGGLVRTGGGPRGAYP